MRSPEETFAAVAPLLLTGLFLVLQRVEKAMKVCDEQSTTVVEGTRLQRGRP